MTTTINRALCVVAHYDDESLFFGGTLLDLAKDGAEIHIAVLTDVAYCNPGKDSQREELRQRMRLGAFARVCMELRAYAYHGDLPQVFEVPAAGWAAISFVYRTIKKVAPDVIITHGEDGDYTGAAYVNGYDVARAQHQLAYDAVHAADPACPIWAYDPAGPVRIPVDYEAKAKLLDFYRYGCTQVPEWPAERWYPQFAKTPQERFRCLLPAPMPSLPTI